MLREEFPTAAGRGVRYVLHILETMMNLKNTIPPGAMLSHDCKRHFSAFVCDVVFRENFARESFSPSAPLVLANA